MGTVILADVTELETVKISELPVATAVGDAAAFPTVSIGKTKKIAKSNLLKDVIVGGDRVAHVSPVFTDNEASHQFSTIQAAIDFAYGKWGPVTDSNNKVVIRLAPGKYTEQIHSYENMLIKSYASGYDALDTEPPATLYNTGADAAHYPLRSDEDEIYELSGINVETDAGGIFGKLPVGDYYSCRFNYGHFIERDSSALAIFSNCAFYGSAYGGFNLTGTNLTGLRNILLRAGCTFRGEGVPTLLSTHVGFANFKWTDTELAGSTAIGGDWDWRVDDCYVYRSAVRSVFSTTGLINIVNSVIINGLHFTSAPASFKMINSSFEGISDNKIPDGEADITSDVVIPDVVYSNNTQHNGISGNIQITCPIKAVGCASLNRYFSLQDAINSIAVSGVIDLRESFVDLAELTIPTGSSVTIDGHKLYSLTFTSDIIELQANESIIFFGLSQLNGGNIEVNGNSAYVGFEECLTANAYVTLTSGTSSYCLVYTSTIKAPTGHPAITQNVTTSTIVLGYSRVDGGVGHPAILTTVEADSGLKAKFSTLIHGDGAGNSPLVYTGANKMDILVYNCALNAAWSAADYTNLIGSPNNTTSPEIDF